MQSKKTEKTKNRSENAHMILLFPGQRCCHKGSIMFHFSLFSSISFTFVRPIAIKPPGTPPMGEGGPATPALDGRAQERRQIGAIDSGR
jgi:hypothetical protein